MDYISSRQNPLIKQITQLHQGKYRTEHGMFIAEGLRACTTLVDAGLELVHLFATETQEEHITPLTQKINPTIVNNGVMIKLSAMVSPSGIVCVFKIPTPPTPEQLTPGLVCVQMNNPGNMGTLIRTTAAMDVKSIVLVEGCDPWSPKVVQASAGTIGMVNMFKWSWAELLEYKKDIPLCALVVSDGVTPDQANIKDSLLVIGSEAHGIPENWLADCKTQVTLSMPGGTESLNAAVAGSIALYFFAQN